MDVRILSHFKHELSWAADKRLWVISTIMMLKTVIKLRRKEVNVLNLKQYCIHCYVSLGNIF